MGNDLEKITAFIEQHHVLSLATSLDNLPSVCSAFYIYDAQSHSFVIASSEETLHIKQVKVNKNVAGNILLETKEIGKIQGLQFFAKMQALEDERLKKSYFKRFPYALALLPKLWQIEVSRFKLTDNRLGFGKKIIYEYTSL
ncbi:pyridoxamine 5'-phosphate oxidase family protein [Sulfurimonas sp.]|uniref:pyridoxamine 5'-phosphate oxidase family protein n=1 Tax=Sulfurimonas sp. TaxID=2022749 RepID=UPI002626251C|nr:pyridoxamine 5'-phosphate oxidase family protein [Sulfurimonas sp.]